MTVCFYCRQPLLTSHEQDHFPIPIRNGGTETVPTCHNCHDLKDRLPLNHWPTELIMQALDECGPLGRIFLAKTFTVANDRDSREAVS